MRVGLISDIHGNIYGLEAALAELASQGVNRVLCAGDTIGYYPFANEVVARLRTDGIITIKGNHETYLLGNMPISEEQRKQCRLDVTEREMTAQNQEWLRSLPDEYRFELNKLRFLLCHGSPWSIEEYVYPNSSGKERFAHLEVDSVIMGHTHIAWQETVQGKWLINPGSCGQPRDGQPGASYAILDSERNLEFHRARYDLSRFIEELRDLEYPKPLIDILLRKK